MDSPNVQNYSLGKGIVCFDRFDENGNSTGELDLGNAPVFALTPSAQVLEHFSSRSGIKNKDKEVETQIGYTFKISLDEYSKENILLALRGDTMGYTSQSDGTVAAEGLTARLGRWVKLEKRKLLTSGITIKNSGGTITYTEGTDYEIDADVGRVKCLSGGAISEAQVLLAAYTYQAASYPTISAGGRMVEGKLRFVGDPTIGPVYEVEVWDVKLKCESEISLITDDWGKLEFTAEVLSDEVGHPTNPWFNVLAKDEDSFGES